MIYLSAENLAKQFTERVLFKDLNFSLDKGQKVGLIASNGAGKSTLLKVLVGKEPADNGTVHLANGISMGYLEQDPVMDESLTINELIDSSHTELLTIIRDYESALENQTNDYSEANQKAFEIASERMAQADAWDYEVRLKKLLSRFEIIKLDQNIKSLSGGEKKRLAMAMALLDNPDLLIMDEPTNHLDVEMIEWLEKYLSKSSITLLMVTHDRYFLDRVCNHIIELEEGKIYHHKGNYGYFLEKKAEREAAFATEIDKAGKMVKKELDWIRRSPKARTTKSKSRIDAFYALKEKASSKPKKEELQLEVKMSRVGGKILEMSRVDKNYGKNIVLSDFSHVFKKGERIGIVGKNGVGKSTFLNLMSGIESPDSGKVLPGQTTVFGYYSQKGLVLKEDKRIIEILTDIAEVITLGNGNTLTASQFLGYFLFPPKMQRTYYSKLSGGEKRRLYLLTVLIQNPNFLILDEPTNDLDLLTLNKLEEFLEGFKGCLLLVSHDRYFMDRLADQLFVFEGNGKVKGYLGTYSDYREELKDRKKEEKAKETKFKAKVEAQVAEPKVKRKLSYKEQVEYDALEKEISSLEKEKSTLEEGMNSLGTDFDALTAHSEKLEKIIALIDEKTLRWLELDEFA